MTEETGDWAETFEAINRPVGSSSTKNTRLGMQDIEWWQNFQRERTGADVAVSLGGVDTGDTFDGWGYVVEWWNNVTNRIFHLNDLGQFDAANLLGLIPNINVEGIAAGEANIAESIGNLIDNLTTAAGNIIGSGFNLGDMFGVFADQQGQIAQINAGLAALQADLAANNNSGVSYTVSFAGMPDGAVPSEFTKISDTGAGGVSVVGGALKWTDSGNSGASELYLFNAGTATTDYFEVSAVMPSKPEADWLGGANSYNRIIGRSNTAGTIYTFAEIGSSWIRVGCMVSGTVTWFGSSVSFSAPAGSYITFRGGTGGGVRVFQVLVNNVVRATFTDTGSVSSIGAGYMSGGLDFVAAARTLGGQNTPGSVSAFTMNDNAPAAVLGTTFRAYRSSTSSITKAAGDVVLPNGCIDTVDYISGDLAWDSTTQKITVSKAGTYIIGMRIRCSDVIEISETWTPLLYKQGTLHSRGSGDTGLDVYGGDSTVAYPSHKLRFSGGAPMMCYLNAGEYVQFGMASAGNQGIVGDAAGTETWVTVARIG